MESERLSQLIGLIYDSATDLDLWPLLLQGLMEDIDERVSPPMIQENMGEYVSQWYEEQEEETELAGSKVRYFSNSENELIGLLLPHLKRTVKINRELVELRAETELLPRYLSVCQ